jgi:amidase
LDHCLHRIEQDGAVNAVITIDEDTARAQAAAADEALVRGEPSGALCGLPMTVKGCHRDSRLAHYRRRPGAGRAHPVP